MNETAINGAPDFVGRRVVGQVQRHQGLETHATRQGGENTLTIFGGSEHRTYGRAQVGHDDGAGELARSVRQDGSERFAVAQVKMPVVRAGKGNLHDHGKREETKDFDIRLIIDGSRPTAPSGAQTAKILLSQGLVVILIVTSINNTGLPLACAPRRDANVFNRVFAERDPCFPPFR